MNIGGSLTDAISKLKSMNLPWAVELSHVAQTDGANPNNYETTLTFKSSTGLEIAIQALPWSSKADRDRHASILVYQCYSDGSKDQLYAGVFGTRDDYDEVQRLTEFADGVSATARQLRANRLTDARAAFFKVTG